MVFSMFRNQQVSRPPVSKEEEKVEEVVVETRGSTTVEVGMLAPGEGVQFDVGLPRPDAEEDEAVIRESVERQKRIEQAITEQVAASEELVPERMEISADGESVKGGGWQGDVDVTVTGEDVPVVIQEPNQFDLLIAAFDALNERSRELNRAFAEEKTKISAEWDKYRELHKMLSQRFGANG